MRILADYHHHALFHALRLVFEDRFGLELYRPVGMDWFDEGYWNFERTHHEDRIAHQYLDPDQSDVDRGDHSTRPDRKNPGRDFRMVTLEQARALDFDFVLSTVPDNDPGLARFAREKGARFGIQVGNQWTHTDWDLPSFALISTTGILSPVPWVRHHQEFELPTFRYEPPAGFGPVRSFVNCFPETPEYPRFRDYAQASDHPFEVYGSYGSEALDEFARGDIEATPDVADAMRASGVIWHAKYWSDGFGHVIHNAFAVGRPVFFSGHYYSGAQDGDERMAWPLMLDGVTGYDIDTRSPDEIAVLIRALRVVPDLYREMCEASAARFREVVDFAAEAEQIGDLLGLGVRV